MIVSYCSYRFRRLKQSFALACRCASFFLSKGSARDQADAVMSLGNGAENDEGLSVFRCAQRGVKEQNFASLRRLNRSTIVRLQVCSFAINFGNTMIFQYIEDCRNSIGDLCVTYSENVAQSPAFNFLPGYSQSSQVNNNQ